MGAAAALRRKLERPSLSEMQVGAPRSPCNACCEPLPHQLHYLSANVWQTSPSRAHPHHHACSPETQDDFNVLVAELERCFGEQRVLPPRNELREMNRWVLWGGQLEIRMVGLGVEVGLATDRPRRWRACCVVSRGRRRERGGAVVPLAHTPASLLCICAACALQERPGESD